MKVKSPDFISQCQVLSFPWTTRRRKTEMNTRYSKVLTFPPPVFTPAMNEESFPLIQMMNGTDPVVWEAGTRKMGGMEVSAGLTSHDWKGEINNVQQARGMGKNGGKNKIPRPKNAFILYRSHVSQMLKGTMAYKVRESNISSLVSEMWKKESEVVHAYYAKRAALEWVQYMKRLQQDRCKQGMEEPDRQKSPTPSDDPVEVNGLEGSSGTEGATTFSSPTMTPLEDTFFALESPKTLEPAVGEVSRMSLSPLSPNGNFMNPGYISDLHRTPGHLPRYTMTNKASQETPFSAMIPPSSCLFKDPGMVGINGLNMDYGYTIPQLSFSTHPYVVGNDLGLDSNLRWPEWVSTPPVWPIQIT